MRALLSATLLSMATLVGQPEAQARDLVVYGEPTLEHALRSVGALWQQRSGTRVNVFVAPTDLSYAQIDRGARCDVILALAGAETDNAAREKLIQAGTVRRALRNGLSLVSAQAGAAPTADATLADLRSVIAGRKLAIANPDRDPAGARALDLLRKVGITVDDRNTSLAIAESSAGVVSLLATGKAELGIIYSSDAAGFRRVWPLPTAEHAPIDYVAATARDPASDTQPFLAFLRSAEATAAFKSAGLMPLDE